MEGGTVAVGVTVSVAGGVAVRCGRAVSVGADEVNVDGGEAGLAVLGAG